jgi:hypothetical protein
VRLSCGGLFSATGVSDLSALPAAYRVAEHSNHLRFKPLEVPVDVVVECFVVRRCGSGCVVEFAFHVGECRALW